jgi:molybdopterin/thiamine biosynthesis adenylyltransferase
MTHAPAGLHSRSVLAGYDPESLAAGKVLVVGLGALGQNVVQNLSLLGVGQLMLVDFDTFEGHNATRSPFFPTHAEVARLGRGKAAVVAHRTAQVSTARDPAVYYSASLIQALGDGAIAWADIVVAAVDSMTARAWLAERSRLLARPMVEGGFSGPDFNLSAFAAATGAVCYRCGRPDRDSSMSCTAYALAAEKANIVPAIQTSAAVLAGYQSEQVVQLLHGRLERLGQRSYGNVRRETLQLAELPANDDCPGIHFPEPVIGTVGNLGAGSTLADFTHAVEDEFGPAGFLLGEPVIANLSCTRCREPCLVQAGESSWLAAPRCTECGGPWPRAAVFAPDVAAKFHTSDHLGDELSSTPLASIGLRAGASVSANLEDGTSGLIRVAGDIHDCVERAVPFDRAAIDLLTATSDQDIARSSVPDLAQCGDGCAAGDAAGRGRRGGSVAGPRRVRARR